MTKWRRFLLLVIALAQMGLGALAWVAVDAIRIKAVESRADDGCVRVLEHLIDEGAISGGLSREEHSRLIVLMKPPVREQLKRTLRPAGAIAVFMILMALPVLAISLWPSRRKGKTLDAR